MSEQGRRWLELSVRGPPSEDAVMLMADVLVQVGGRGALEQEGRCVAYFEEPDDLNSFLQHVHARLASGTGLDDIELEARWQLHEDWAESWKRGLAPRRITDRIVVRPSWTSFEPDSGDVVIVLDPGMAFGTAEHETTRGCLRLLDRTVSPGDNVIDVGSGSGILAVAAALIGASEVLAIEGDLLACEALRENLDRNGVAERVRCADEWVDVHSLGARAPVDGVVANIETGVLRPLLDGFRAVLRPGGWLILSGIGGDEWEAFMADTEDRGFRFGDVDSDGEWCSGLFRRILS